MEKGELMKIVLTQQAYKKFMFGVMNCDKEIGYMGRIKFDKKTCTYIVTQVYLPTQQVTGATTDLDADSVAKCEIASINEEGYFNAWLHSHVNMGVFWSATDTATIKEMGQKGLCVAIVGNKKKEMRGAVYVHSSDDFVPDIHNDNVPVSVEEEAEPLNQVWLEEIAKNVRTFSPITKGYGINPHKESYYKNRQSILTEADDTLQSRYNKNDYSQMYLNDDYGHYGTWQDEMLTNIPDKKRQYTGTSSAYKKETKKAVQDCYSTKTDSIIFIYGATKLTCKMINALSRDEVQDIIDGNPGMPEQKKIELMSKWYYIPTSFSL